MRTTSIVLAILLALTGLSGCTSDDKKASPADTAKLQARLDTAKKTIDDAETI